MWVRWVHGIYTKGGNWRDFNVPITLSWAFKKICKIKDRLDQWVHNGSYSIQEVYHGLLGAGQPVNWASFVWNRSSIPKARFILWLAVNDRLKSRDKLFALGLISTDVCPLCGLISESNTHLFFACIYSLQCLRDILTWLDFRMFSDSLADFAS